MKCISEEKLWEYLDEEIAIEEKSQIEEHLTECTYCNKELDELMFFNSQFSNAINDTKEEKINSINNSLVEIELCYNDTKPQLKKYWKGIIAFGGITIFLTLTFITLACPVSNKMIFEAEFNSVTYQISQLLYFMTKPIIMNIWVVVFTFSILFWIDKKLLILNRTL